MKTVFLLAVVMATGLFASAASAQPARTFVASTGTDANPCSIAAPCRTLQRGIDAVASGGDVLIQDAGGFGSSVIITKSVSVFAPPGGQSRLRAAEGGEPAVRVQGPDIVVSIANLGITGVDNHGVLFINGRSLSLSNLDISVNNLGLFGVRHSAGGGHLMMENTILRNSGNCFAAQGTAGLLARATIVNSQALECTAGFRALQYSNVAIRNSIANGDRNLCFRAFDADGPDTFLALDHVLASNCTYGIYSVREATAAVSNSTFSANGAAATTDEGGIGFSYGNNRIFGNANNSLIGFTSIAEQ